MAKIAIIDDKPEVVSLVSFFLTKGDREFLKRIGTSRHVLNSIIDFRPDVLVLPLHRQPESLNRPIEDYEQDVGGSEVLSLMSATPELVGVPIILIGFYTTEADMPAAYRAKVRFNHYLVFPEGLQELNPTISSYVGPSGGSMQDVERLRAR